MDTNKLPAILRAHDLEAHGIPRSRLPGMLRRGEIERVSRGLYRLHDAPVHELETIAAVCKRVPGAITCLLTALAVHEIGTQAPRHVWIAIDRKARKPQVPDLPVRVVRFSGAMLRYGIQTREVLGVTVRLTSPARTVVDCFRYRNKVGMDVAFEALRDAIQSRKATVNEIIRAAHVCRIQTVISPYLESVLA
ncbi:MAG: type IV toxin-antitoxin system AbiEi family antitoxin domain-containing protein [Betaproteobacteria bacterium]